MVATVKHSESVPTVLIFFFHFINKQLCIILFLRFWYLNIVFKFVVGKHHYTKLMYNFLMLVNTKKNMSKDLCSLQVKVGVCFKKIIDLIAPYSHHSFFYRNLDSTLTKKWGLTQNTSKWKQWPIYLTDVPTCLIISFWAKSPIYYQTRVEIPSI